MTPLPVLFQLLFCFEFPPTAVLVAREALLRDHVNQRVHDLAETEDYLFLVGLRHVLSHKLYSYNYRIAFFPQHQGHLVRSLDLACAPPLPVLA